MQAVNRDDPDRYYQIMSSDEDNQISAMSHEAQCSEVISLTKCDIFF